MRSTARSEAIMRAEMDVRSTMRRTLFLRLVLLSALIIIWVILDRKFELFRSHFWLTLLGSGVSAVGVGLIAYGIGRRTG